MLSDNKVIEIFYMADDICKSFNETVKKHSIEDGKKHRDKPCRLSDAEMITILIMFHLGGYKCLKHFYNLNGFTETIRSVFPNSATQICVVHQIRNSCKYVVYKDKKEFTSDMKNIYNAPNKDVAAAELDNLERKWGGKYPYAIQSWRKNWDNLTVFFQFPLEIRNIIYTTNLIENLNGKLRKYTKSKPSFPTDDAVKKTVFLSLMEIEKKWTQPIHNWGVIMNQFICIFADRLQI